MLPISNMIRDRGFEAAFFWFGLGQGTLVVAASLILRAPAQETGDRFAGATHRPPAPVATGLEMMRTPIFWLLYAMFTLVATGGLMAAAQLGPIAKHYEIADVPVSLFGITAAALPFALSLDRVLNGVSRPFFGWVSDHLGRENTLGVALVLEGLAILLFINYVRVPAMFVILTGLTFFAWGEIYSLFPALCGDLFGRKYATTNYGLLYTAKGTAVLLVPLGSLIQQSAEVGSPCSSWLASSTSRRPCCPLCPQAMAAPLAGKKVDRRGRRSLARQNRETRVARRTSRLRREEMRGHVPPLDLPGRRPRQRVGEVDLPGDLEVGQPVEAESGQVGLAYRALQDDGGLDFLAVLGVGRGEADCLGNRRVLEQGRVDLEGRDLSPPRLISSLSRPVSVK